MSSSRKATLQLKLAAVQRQAQKGSPISRGSKSVYDQRNLTAIEAAKSKKAKEVEVSSATVILRILRMRSVPFSLQ